VRNPSIGHPLQSDTVITRSVEPIFLESAVVVDMFDINALQKRLLAETSISATGKANAPEAAVAIIVNPNYDDGAILFIRRTERETDPWSGQIAFPGGHRGPNDHDLKETAIREAKEEVGINLRDHACLGLLPPMYTRSRQMFVAPFIFQLNADVNIRLNEEVAKSFWVTLSDLTGIRVSKSKVYTQDRKLLVDSYVYQTNVIWGLTFRIINTLLDRKTVD
jgi:8-oxo-dGTP pyrophosphatase MutT (NUDIX family)